MNECPSAGTLPSVNTWWFTWTEWMPWMGVGLAQVLLLLLAFLLSWHGARAPALANPDQTNCPGAMRLPGEKALEKEFSTDLATWPMSPADANVSGCLAGAPRECGTKRTLGIPCRCAALKCFQRPGHRLPVASWLCSHLMADGRTTGGVGPGRGCLGKVAVFSVPWVSLSQRELSCLSPPLQEDA